MNKPKEVYVGNLSFDTTEEDIRRLFKDYGTIENVHMPVDKESEKFTGFAFVRFADENLAAKVKVNFDGHVLAGRTLKVGDALGDKPKEKEA